MIKQLSKQLIIAAAQLPLVLTKNHVKNYKITPYNMARSRPKCGFYIAKCYLHQLDTNTRYINYNNNRFFFFLLFIVKVASKHMDCHKKSLKILYIIFIDFFMVLYRPFAAYCTLQQGCQTYGSRTPLTYLTITNMYLAFP